MTILRGARRMHVWARLILSGALLASAGGCAAGPYRQSGWLPDNSESDWDLDSAICLQRSETLTEEDLEAVEELKVHARSLKQNASSIARVNRTAGPALSENTGAALNVLAGILSFQGQFSEETAIEKIQESKFSDCMNERGWERW